MWTGGPTSGPFRTRVLGTAAATLHWEPLCTPFPARPHLPISGVSLHRSHFRETYDY